MSRVRRFGGVAPDLEHISASALEVVQRAPGSTKATPLPVISALRPGHGRRSGEACVVEMRVELTRTRTNGRAVSVEKLNWSVVRHEQGSSEASAASMARLVLRRSGSAAPIKRLRPGMTLLVLAVSTLPVGGIAARHVLSAPAAQQTGATMIPILGNTSIRHLHGVQDRPELRSTPTIAVPSQPSPATPMKGEQAAKSPAHEEGQELGLTEQSRRATLQAFRSGTVESWTEDGVQKHVLAIQPEAGAKENCRLFTYWQAGDEQGAATDRSLCLGLGRNEGSANSPQSAPAGDR